MNENTDLRHEYMRTSASRPAAHGPEPHAPAEGQPIPPNAGPLVRDEARQHVELVVNVHVDLGADFVDTNRYIYMCEGY